MKTTKIISQKEIETKAEELSKHYDCEVTPIIIMANSDQVIGYLKEPCVNVILYASDKFLEKKLSDAGEAILKDCLIIGESDIRINSDERKHAKIKSSFIIAATKLAIPYVDEYKKK